MPGMPGYTKGKNAEFAKGGIREPEGSEPYPLKIRCWKKPLDNAQKIMKSAVGRTK
jgi:hypothetical protein